MSTIDLLNVLNGMKLSDLKVLARHLGFYNVCVPKEDLIESLVHTHIDGLLKRTSHLTKMLANFRKKNYALAGNDLLEQIKSYDPNAEVYAVRPCSESVWVKKVLDAIEELELETKFIVTGRNEKSYQSNNEIIIEIVAKSLSKLSTTTTILKLNIKIAAQQLLKRKRTAPRITETETESESEAEAVPARKKKVAQPSVHVRKSVRSTPPSAHVRESLRLTPGYYGDTDIESDVDEFTEMNFHSTDDDELSISIPDEKLLKRTIEGVDYLKYGNTQWFQQLPVGTELTVEFVNLGNRKQQVCSLCRVQIQGIRDRDFHLQYTHFGGFKCKCKKWFFSERGRFNHTCKRECEILTIKGGNITFNEGLPDYYVYAIPISRRNQKRILIYRTALGDASVAAHRKINESKRQKAIGFVTKNQRSVGCTSFNECMHGDDPWQIHPDEAFFLPMPGGNNHVTLIIRSFCRRMLNTKGHSVTLACLTTLFDYSGDFIERLQTCDEIRQRRQQLMMRAQSNAVLCSKLHVKTK